MSIGAPLQRITIERLSASRWKLVRERDGGNGETFVCDDLLEAFETVSAAYRPDGTPRGWRPELCSTGFDAPSAEQKEKART